MEKVIIFDLDGTLLNTLDDLTDSTNFALNKFNCPTKTKEQVRTYIGNGVEKLIMRALPNGIDTLNFDEVLETFKTHYSENMHNKTSPFDGIIEILHQLKEKKYKLAVSSNKFDKAVKELSKKYFDNLIDFAIGEDEKNGIRKKPHSDEIIEIFKYFNTNNAIYIGDSEVDIMTAKNANLKCISVIWGYKDEEFLLKNGAKIIAKTPQELFEKILQNI